jgi:hypothetical protein
MSATLLLALSLSVPGAGPEAAVTAALDQPAELVAVAEPRSATLLRRDVRAALRETAAIKKVEPIAAAERLLPLYVEVRLHPELNDADRLYWAGTIRGRLQKLGARLENAAELNAPGEEVLAQIGGAIGGNGGAIGGQQQPERDRGQELVELIQTVIAPDTWDVNGGPGSIYYYAPLRVLVIRQTAAVHGRLGDAMGQLRGN